MKNQSLGRIEDKHCLGVVIGLNKEILIAFNLRTGIICCYMSIYSFRTVFLFIHLYRVVQKSRYPKKIEYLPNDLSKEVDFFIDDRGISKVYIHMNAIEKNL
jgi:hypothetical protein